MHADVDASAADAFCAEGAVRRGGCLSGIRERHRAIARSHVRHARARGRTGRTAHHMMRSRRAASMQRNHCAMQSSAGARSPVHPPIREPLTFRHRGCAGDRARSNYSIAHESGFRFLAGSAGSVARGARRAARRRAHCTHWRGHLAHLARRRGHRERVRARTRARRRGELAGHVSSVSGDARCALVERTLGKQRRLEAIQWCTPVPVTFRAASILPKTTCYRATRSTPNSAERYLATGLFGSLAHGPAG